MKKRFKYALLEAVGLNLIVFIFFFIFNPVKEDFISLNLHPLLLVVVFMTLRYGKSLGLLSATISSFTFITGYFLVNKELYLFILDFDNYKFILMFYLAALILGRFRNNYEVRLAEQAEKYQNLKQEYYKLKQNYEKIKVTGKELNYLKKKERESKDKYYQETEIMKYEDFKEIFKEEKKRKEDYNLDYGLIKFKKGNYSLNVWNEKLKELIREEDITAYSEEEDIIYILLPVTYSKFVSTVESRIKEAFNYDIEREG